MLKLSCAAAAFLLFLSSAFGQSDAPQCYISKQPAWLSAAWMSPQSAVDVFAGVDKLGRLLQVSDVAKYAAAANSSPSNEAAAAKYGYSVYLGVRQGLNLQSQLDSFVLNPSYGLKAVTKAYARSYFLCCSIDDWLAPHWSRQIGVRLLQGDPNDYYVLYGICRMSDPWRSPAKKAAGLALARRMIRLQPQSFLGYYAEYLIYSMCAMTNGDIASMDAAITVGQQCLTLKRYPVASTTLPRQLHLMKLLRLEYIQQQQAGTMPKIWYPPATPPVPAKTAPITVIYGTDSEELTPTPNGGTPTPAPGSSSSKDGSNIKGVKITPPSDVAATTYYNSGSVTAPVRTKDPWGTYDSAVHEMQDGTLGGGRGGINYVDGAGGDWSAPTGYSKYVWNFSGSASSAIPLDPDVSGGSAPTLPVTGSAEQGYEWDISPAQTYCGPPFTAMASVSVSGPNATASGSCTVRYHAPFEVPTLVSGPTYSQKWYLKPLSCSPAVGGTLSSTQTQLSVSIAQSTAQEYAGAGIVTASGGLTAAPVFYAEDPYVAATLAVAGYLTDEPNGEGPNVTFRATTDQWNFAVQQTELWNSSGHTQGAPMILNSTPALFTGTPSVEMKKCCWVPCLAINSYYTSYAVSDYSSDGYDGESTYTVRTPDSVGIECIFTEKI